MSIITGKKDDVFLEFKELDSLKTRIALSKFVIEDALLVKRAVADGLAVEKIIYTERFLSGNDSDGVSGKDVLKDAKTNGIDCYKISDGLLGAVTATRPIPLVLASVRNLFYDEIDEIPTNNCNNCRALLVIDSVANPDNLGMILRTADASGIDGVAIIGNGAGSYHKNCIRAARGAVGRLPILVGASDNEILTKIKEKGFTVIGTSAEASDNIYEITYDKPVAFVVGNESNGIRQNILNQCDKTVSIPMLPGRDSLSVGVAAGILIYEWVRNQQN